jgi:hypothetical protein
LSAQRGPPHPPGRWLPRPRERGAPRPARRDPPPTRTWRARPIASLPANPAAESTATTDGARHALANAVDESDVADPETDDGKHGNFIARGGTMSISANGASNGILWTLQSGGVGVPGILHAYDATNLSHELYNSNQAGSRDALDEWDKFSAPVVANGEVFVTSNSQLTV